MLQYTMLQYTMLQYTMLQYTILQYTLLQYTLLQYSSNAVAVSRFFGSYSYVECRALLKEVQVH